MRIGITYDLRVDYLHKGFAEEDVAEFDEPETIEAIEAALQSLGHQPDRIGNFDALMHRLALGDRWDLVFNIAEGMHGYGREALVPAVLDAHGIAYVFSDPLSLAITLHKPTAKRIVRDHGLPTPEFAVAERLADLDSIDLPFPLFVKPVAEGTSKGIGKSSKVDNREQLRRQCEITLDHCRQPVLIERYLSGREFTVGILAQDGQPRAIGAMEIMLTSELDRNAYSFANKKYYAERVDFRLATDDVAASAAGLALEAWKVLGCRDGGRIDVRCDQDGRACFLEANPLAGLHPNDSDLVILARIVGMTYNELIHGLLSSALYRIRKG